MGSGFVEFRKKAHGRHGRVTKAKLGIEIDASFQETFGRSYGGQIETYRCDDADTILLTSGSAAGTARDGGR